MTANGRSPPNPFAQFDVAPMATAARTIVTNRGPLMDYVAAVRHPDG